MDEKIFLNYLIDHQKIKPDQLKHAYELNPNSPLEALLQQNYLSFNSFEEALKFFETEFPEASEPIKTVYTTLSQNQKLSYYGGILTRTTNTEQVSYLSEDVV